MNHKFTAGVLTGMTALTAAVPLAAQIAGAQTAGSAAATSVAAQFQGGVMKWTKPAPATKEAVQAMIERDRTLLANIDAMVALHKSATQAHLAALQAALAIEDDAQREEAVRKAHEDMRATIQAAVEANPALKAAMPFGGPGHHGKMKVMKSGIAEKLGMTADELKAAVDSGKTIEQIAEEKGITLPEKPAFKMKMHRGFGPMGKMPAASADAQ